MIKGKEDGYNILVHCARGKSRSASMVIGYLIWKEKISFEEAYYRVKKKRPIIAINHGFEKQLKAFEKCRDDIKL